MSLNNISLNSQMLAALYPNVLVETSPGIPNPKSPVRFLGNNKNGVLIVVSSEQVAYLEDTELNFLSNVLTACKLSIADVAIVNVRSINEANYQALTNELNSKYVLLFGTEPEAIDLPFKFPHFQLQQFGALTFLSAPRLKNIEEDKALKAKLWSCLKNLFGL